MSAHNRGKRILLLFVHRGLAVIDRYDAPETLFYCDLPYLGETRSTWGAKNGAAYEHEMTEDDHRALALRLNTIQGMALVNKTLKPRGNGRLHTGRISIMNP